MAWTSLSFAFGSTLTSTKMTQLYDNITAVANGDSGAPKVTADGMTAPGGSSAAYTVGVVGESTTASGSYTILGGFTCIRAGTYRTRVGVADSIGSSNAVARVYVNGVATGTERQSTSASLAYFNQNLTFAQGDAVQLYARNAGGGTTTAALLVQSSTPTIGAFGPQYGTLTIS